jgi:hypothetical protein
MIICRVVLIYAVIDEPDEEEAVDALVVMQRVQLERVKPDHRGDE